MLVAQHIGEGTEPGVLLQEVEDQELCHTLGITRIIQIFYTTQMIILV